MQRPRHPTATRAITQRVLLEFSDVACIGHALVSAAPAAWFKLPNLSLITGFGFLGAGFVFIQSDGAQ